MPTSVSLRGILTYASNLLGQLPLSLDISRPFTTFDLGFSSQSVDVVPYIPLSGAPSCPIDGPMSCHNSTPHAGNPCCFVYPGGRLVLTQRWDREIYGGGANEEWTIRGLRPARCDGSSHSTCARNPRFDNITDVLKQYSQTELLGFLDRYWVTSEGGNPPLWAVEYNEHATCINTLAASCYGDAYAVGVEVVDYFARASQLFRLLDTYTALMHAGIVPSAAQRYPLGDIVSTLERFSGGRVVVRCSGGSRDILHEVRYLYYVQGSLQSGEFVPAQDLGDRGDAGNCAPRVRYQPKLRKASSLGR